MNKRFLPFLVLLFLAGAVSAQQKEALQPAPSWTAVLATAQKESKLIFVDLYFTGCHPCAQMDKEVFPNELVHKELTQNFVAVKIDVFKEKLGDTLNMRYGVSGYPTFLILDPSGKLLSMFAGYKDPGLLLTELTGAKWAAQKKKYLSGFTAEYRDHFPEFYITRYKDRKPADAVAANAYIQSQKDWMSEPVALSIFATGKLEERVKEFVVNNVNEYRKRFGADLVLEKASRILTEKLTKKLEGKRNDRAFEQFLGENEGRFAGEDWKIIRQGLSFTYYQQIAKDTTALLHFANRYPVLHMGYMSALYSRMVVAKQLNEPALSLFCQWADQVITEESAMDMIQLAANLHKQHSNTEGYKKYMQMALAKAKKYRMPADRYEKALAQP